MSGSCRVTVELPDSRVFERSVLEWHSDGNPFDDAWQYGFIDDDEVQCLVILEDEDGRYVDTGWWLVNEKWWIDQDGDGIDVIAWTYWPGVPEEVG